MLRSAKDTCSARDTCSGRRKTHAPAVPRRRKTPASVMLIGERHLRGRLRSAKDTCSGSTAPGDEHRLGDPGRTEDRREHRPNGDGPPEDTGSRNTRPETQGPKKHRAKDTRLKTQGSGAAKGWRHQMRSAKRHLLRRFRAAGNTCSVRLETPATAAVKSRMHEGRSAEDTCSGDSSWRETPARAAPGLRGAPVRRCRADDRPVGAPSRRRSRRKTQGPRGAGSKNTGFETQVRETQGPVPRARETQG